MICEECRIGRYRFGHRPYLHLLGSQMIVVPNVPALICDVCGKIEHDPDYIRDVNYLIDQTTGSGTESTTVERHLLLASRPAWLRPRRSV